MRRSQQGNRTTQLEDDDVKDDDDDDNNNRGAHISATCVNDSYDRNDVDINDRKLGLIHFLADAFALILNG